MGGQVISCVRNEYAEIARLLQASLNSDASPDSTTAVLDRLLRSARLQLGMKIAFISRFENGRRIFKYVDKAAGIEIVKVGESDPLEDTYCQRVVDGRLPQLMQNAQDHVAALQLKVTRQLGIGGYVSTPVTLNDSSVYGTFCCFSFRKDDSLNRRDLGLLQAFAEIAAELLENSEQISRDIAPKRVRIRSSRAG